MNITREEINQHIPKEVIDKLPVMKFNAGEIILGIEDKHILFILSGEAHFMRYQKNKKIVFPLVYKKNSIAGFNILITSRGSNWELLSTSDGEAIVFPYDIIEKYILNVSDTFQFLTEKTVYLLEDAITGFYILAHGGAKAYFAFILIEGAENSCFTFRRYEDFAEALGISKSLLYRITASLIKEKLIRKERKTIVILNTEGLKDLYREYLYF